MMDTNLCLDCNENEAYDNFRCFGCYIDYNFSETIWETEEAK